MQFVARVFLSATLLIDIVYAQGGGGGGGGGGGAGKPCRLSIKALESCFESRDRVFLYHRRINWYVSSFLLGAFLGIFGIVFCVYYCCQCCKGKPRRSNSKFVTKSSPTNEETYLFDVKLFESGYWISRYRQYNKWHEPSELSLSFDHQGLTITGSGSDTVGTYAISGIYSPQSRRLGLTKVYQLDTGNKLENLGHTVTIQLEWNGNSHQFEGKWYVRTKMFHGEDVFELKFGKLSKQFTQITCEISN